MQRLTGQFQEYIRQAAASSAAVTSANGVTSAGSDEQRGGDNEQTAGQLKVVIHWRVLGQNREDQTIAEDTASITIVKLLVALITTFGEPMKQQLTELPVIRYPLSRTPAAVFLTAAGQQLNSVPVPGTDLYFCPHSDNQQKVRQLRKLFSLLALPDGRDFPSGSVEVSIDSEPPTPQLL